ncbi:MAG: RNA-binding protein [Acidobacteria bacterium]|nr:RNA-binding protein [Acidobacteriota bacterium]MCI0620431.1 RNA-binding protein [Acidobacteriota bacterium]MCI0719197.1 RNA-binding protein [Acidobacteriota bacterium]
MEAKLYVGNLSYNTTEDDLRDLFAQAGTVKSATLIRDRDTGRSKGFAFVEMETQDEAQKAISQFHGSQFQDRALTVNMARPREERGGGGFDNRRGGDRSGGGRPRGAGGGGGGRRRSW